MSLVGHDENAKVKEAAPEETSLEATATDGQCRC